MCIQPPIRKLLNQISGLKFLDRLRDFKESYCDENILIVEALKGELKGLLLPPILDVGAGLGDIAESAFPDLGAILLDINNIPSGKSHLHKRIVGDFFQYMPDTSLQPRTLLFCHVIQYLDHDLERLCQKVASLKPDVIIEVSNDNDGAFGKIMHWSLTAINDANPEFRFQFFDPEEYRMTRSIPIQATLRCPNFEIMARHFVEFLIDANPTDISISKVEQKLKELLTEPRIPINQTIQCYERAR